MYAWFSRLRFSLPEGSSLSRLKTAFGIWTARLDMPGGERETRKQKNRKSNKNRDTGKNKADDEAKENGRKYMGSGWGRKGTRCISPCLE